jgi:hypothetical protein
MGGCDWAMAAVALSQHAHNKVSVFFIIKLFFATFGKDNEIVLDCKIKRKKTA